MSSFLYLFYLFVFSFPPQVSYFEIYLDKIRDLLDGERLMVGLVGDGDMVGL